jgi:cardiolipin synthase
VRIQSPYFLPDQQLIAALSTAARRGVIVDVVVPGANNLKLVNAAMMAQFDQLIMTGCRIWRAAGTFDHSKLFTVDQAWSYIGSSNIDPRSLRLNFELDIEVYDRDLSMQLDARMDASIAKATLITLESLNGQPFWVRLRNKMVWLASPYL